MSHSYAEKQNNRIPGQNCQPSLICTHSVDFHEQTIKNLCGYQEGKTAPTFIKKTDILLSSTLQSGDIPADVSKYSFRSIKMKLISVVIFMTKPSTLRLHIYFLKIKKKKKEKENSLRILPMPETCPYATPPDSFQA